MAHILCSTKLKNGRFSTICAWPEGPPAGVYICGNDVYICGNDKAENRVHNHSGKVNIHLTHAEMEYMCKNYLASRGSK
jgi:hypothetical protein